MSAAPPPAPGSKSGPWGPRGAAWALLLLAGLGTAGCGSRGGARPVPVAELGPTAGLEERLWRLEPDDLWTQRLFRMHYDGPEGDGSFKLTLRLGSPDLFQITAVDRLGRRWWSLAVEDAEALVLNHRAKSYCRHAEEIELEAIPLGPLPFRTLPALLLGRLPLRAASPVAVDGDELSFRDHRDRRWSAVLEKGRLANWTLWAEGMPEVWWQALEEWALLSARREGLQLRWKQVVAEPMSSPLTQMEVPDGYLPGACADAEAERRGGLREGNGAERGDSDGREFRIVPSAAFGEGKWR